MEDEHETLSLRARRKKSSVSLSCCFNNGHRRADSLDISSSSSVSPSPRILSPSTWIRSKTNDLPDIKLKGRCKNLISRVGRHRRHSSADFSYDPLSYSLNFEDSDHDLPSDRVEEFPMRSFASRLPSSPPPPQRTQTTTIAAAPPPGTRRMMLNMTQRTPPNAGLQLPTSRAAAVAEVRSRLELPTPRNVEELRRGLDIPTPRKVITTATETRRSLEDVSPALVASPTSRQVLVELC